MDVGEKLKDEFDIFLSKVKEIGSIINDISSSEDDISKKGIERADEYLSQEKETSSVDAHGNFTVYNKSSLNRKILEKPTEEKDLSRMSPDEFMAAVEKDVKDRCKRKNSKK